MCAAVAESADASDLKSDTRSGVRVQVPPAALYEKARNYSVFGLLLYLGIDGLPLILPLTTFYTPILPLRPGHL